MEIPSPECCQQPDREALQMQEYFEAGPDLVFKSGRRKGEDLVFPDSIPCVKNPCVPGVFPVEKIPVLNCLCSLCSSAI